VNTVVVAAAIIERDGRFLITRRQPGVPLAGYWEFPGGKCQPGETVSHCLARELKEELAVEADVGPEIFATTHDYPDRSVHLHFLECKLIGDPTPQMGQEMQWVDGTALESLAFPPADLELIRMLGRASYTSRHRSA
jgi:8-oxo-dGTP diphosphatase